MDDCLPIAKWLILKIVILHLSKGVARWLLAHSQLVVRVFVMVVRALLGVI